LLIDEYRKGKGKNEDHLNALWMHMETLASLLGMRPPTLGVEFEMPSVWAAVGQMATMMEKLVAKIETMRPQALIAQAKTSVEMMFIDKFLLFCEEFDKSLGNSRSTFVLASRALCKRIGNLKVLTAGYTHSGPGSDNTKDNGQMENKTQTT
jgi:hypothetical protein